MGRDGTVVDDPPALRRLVLHQPERPLGAEEGAGQVDVDDPLPVLDGELFQWHGRRAGPGVIEQQVEAAESGLRRLEQGGDRGRIGDIGRAGQGSRFGVFGEARGFLKELGPAPREGYLPSGLQ